MSDDDLVSLSGLSRPEITGAVTRGAYRALVHLGLSPLLEVTLPNGRRADLMAISPKGELTIVEVKSGHDDFRADVKWPEYLPYCDRFYFAVAPEFPQHVLPQGPGLIVADAFGGAVVIDSPLSPLAGGRLLFTLGSGPGEDAPGRPVPGHAVGAYRRLASALDRLGIRAPIWIRKNSY